MPSPLARARSAAAGALLARVAGPDANASRHRIHHTPGPRWFDPGSPIGRVHGDASMFVGGVRALLLQSLHPRAMAAVAAHSGYRSDPWGRLQRTATFIAQTTFATAQDAQLAVDVVRAVHARIRGVTSEGLEYAASDPHLLTWVHVAEVDSFLTAHQHYGRRPLTPDEADEYVAQAAVIARALGAEDVPTTTAELADRLAGYRPELRATPEAATAARFLLLTPPLPLPARPVYGLIAGAGVALMPRWSRAPLALPDLPPVDAALLRPAGALVTRTIRWALDPVDPRRGWRADTPDAAAGDAGADGPAGHPFADAA